VLGFLSNSFGCLIILGVLLLNAVLTVDAHQANSHKDRGWEKVTDATISWISQNLNAVVFLLWGAYAQKKAAMVDKVREFSSRRRASARCYACNPLL